MEQNVIRDESYQNISKYASKFIKNMTKDTVFRAMLFAYVPFKFPDMSTKDYLGFWVVKNRAC